MTGGSDGNNTGIKFNLAEIYNPATGTFTTANMGVARDDHAATLLTNGMVLIAGGRDSSGNDLTSAELFNNGTFVPTGNLNAARRAHSAIRLQNGNVLIVGGTDTTKVLNSAEIYNPTTGTFSFTGNLNTARARAALALLPSGLVLAAGGNNTTQFSSAELYNPSTGTFTPTGSMANARTGHTATLLPNGTVLVVGGSNSSSFSLSSAEIYNPATGTFSPTGSLNVGREIHSATLLPNGMVLIAGGVGANGPLDSAELYNPATGTFKVTGSLNSERYSHTATLMNNGAVLVVGGQDYFTNSSGLTVELLRSGETFLPELRVLTSHNDHKRTGQNVLETTLTTANVNASSFGKLFSQPVDGYIYAQPLYVPNVTIPNLGTHNVIYVATEGDSVYAFDADSNTGANASPLWHASLLDAAHGAAAGETTVNPVTDDGGCGNILPQVGITSTPVIDPNTNSIYVVAKSKQPGTSPPTFMYRLHVLDMTTGAEKAQGPVVITATVPGNGSGSVSGSVTFRPSVQTNRAGLLFLNGSIHIGFASTCDISPYHGWLFSYDAATFTRQGAFITTPNTTSGGSTYGAGGIWMAGSGLAADAEDNIFLATGNGDYDASEVDFGDSIMKFNTADNMPTLIDYFTPANESSLLARDADLGSGGLVLLPPQPGNNMHVLVQAGKEGVIYVVNRDQMTADNQHFCSTCVVTETQIVQQLGQEGDSAQGPAGAVGGMWGKPVYWNNQVYFWGDQDHLKAFPLSNGLLGSPLVATDPTHNYPGESLWVSADGGSHGIVWSIEADGGSAILKAHDAVTLGSLYRSDTNTADNAGGPVKFAIPVAVNGKVYVGAQNQLSVFGLTF